jgi:uncharacterized protein (TIGR03118 family)
VVDLRDQDRAGQKLSPSTPTRAPGSTPNGARHRGSRHRGRVALATAAAAALALVGASGPAVAHDGQMGHHDHAFQQVNLVSDRPGLAQLTDADVVNPWGIDFGPTTPLWVSNQGSNTLTLYRGATTAAPTVEKVPLVIKASSPTGMLFNPTTKFAIEQGGKTAPATFLMNENVPPGDPATATGQVTAWSNASASPPPTTTVVRATANRGTYAGLTLIPATRQHGPRLLAVNDGAGRIGVYDGRFHLRHLGKKAFVDPRAAADGVVPYNAAYLHGRVYVSYFGESSSALSVFRTDGRFVRRLATGGPLDAPWGMTIAPKHWGAFGGALLVGNSATGRSTPSTRAAGTSWARSRTRRGRRW